MPFEDFGSVLFISMLPLCCRKGKKEVVNIEWLVNRNVKQENLGENTDHDIVQLEQFSKITVVHM